MRSGAIFDINSKPTPHMHFLSDAPIFSSNAAMMFDPKHSKRSLLEETRTLRQIFSQSRSRPAMTHEWLTFRARVDRFGTEAVLFAPTLTYCVPRTQNVNLGMVAKQISARTDQKLSRSLQTTRVWTCPSGRTMLEHVHGQWSRGTHRHSHVVRGSRCVRCDHVPYKSRMRASSKHRNRAGAKPQTLKPLSPKLLTLSRDALR